MSEMPAIVSAPPPLSEARAKASPPPQLTIRVLRHDPREVSDEKQPIEGAFLACSLWLADAYVLTGEIDKAQAVHAQAAQELARKSVLAVRSDASVQELDTATAAESRASADIAVAHDGSLLVSEDGNGTIWRVTH